MILDKGYCSVYSQANTASGGRMPVMALTLKYQSWYAELNFETSPIKLDEQEGIAVSNRIRIIQNRAVTNHDVVILSTALPPPNGLPRYEVTRVYHGVDPDNGQPISDLTLERMVQSDA